MHLKIKSGIPLWLLGIALLYANCKNPTNTPSVNPPLAGPPPREIKTNWDQAYYKPDNFTQSGIWRPQAYSGDEWFYDTKTYPVGNSYEIIGAGYTSFVGAYYDDQSGCFSESGGGFSTEDFEMANYRRGSYLLHLTKITPGVPTPIQNATYGLVGELHAVTKTSDGGYAATGFTRSCRVLMNDNDYLPLPMKFVNQGFLNYNPSDNSCAQGGCGRFENWANVFHSGQKNINHLVVLKTDANLELEWAYIYGMTDYNATGTLNKTYQGNTISKVFPANGFAWLCSSMGTGLVELPNGNFVVTGSAVDPAYSFSNYPATAPQDCNWYGGGPWGHHAVTRGFIMEIDYRGMLQWRKATGPTDRNSDIAGIVKTTQSGLPTYVVGGEEQGNHHMASVSGTSPTCLEKIPNNRAYAAGLDAQGNQLWRQSYSDNPAGPDPNLPGTFLHPSVQVRDLAIDVNDRVLLPVVENGRYHNGNIWGLTYGNTGKGDAVVHVLDPANGNALVPKVELGEVAAFDCQLGVTGLPDGGFAAVGSRQAAGIPFYSDQSGNSQWPNIMGKYSTAFWGTDAYVARCNPGGEIIWQHDFPYTDGLAPPFAAGTNNSPENWLFPPDPGYVSFLNNQGMPDFKRQECLYKINSVPGNKLLIGGNSSENIDDNLAMEIEDGDYILLDNREIAAAADYTAPDYIRAEDVRVRACEPIRAKFAHFPSLDFDQCGVSTMRACDFVELRAGFHAEAGSQFTAKAGYCPVK